MTITLDNVTLTKDIVHEVERQSSTNVIKSKMTVSAQSLPVLMNMLTNMYANPEKSVVQEYISNALDSHAESQTDRIIEISSPTYLSPTFVVKDYGTGMSFDEMNTIYTSYGESTKRNNLEAIGNFGLGCKSALAIANSFTVSAVKNGEKTVMVISRGDDGVGDVEIPLRCATDEPNGVTVTIPVKDSYNFSRYISEFTRNLRPGHVTVDGEEPVSIYSSGTYIEEISTLISGITQRPVPSVNVGGIVYQVDTEQTDIVIEFFDMTVDIPIGAVDFTPSRDSLRYTPRTIQYLQRVFEKVSSEISDYIIQRFLEARGVLNAAQVYNQFDNLLNNSRDTAVQAKILGMHAQTQLYRIDDVKLWKRRTSVSQLAREAHYSPKFMVIDPNNLPRGFRTWVTRWNSYKNRTLYTAVDYRRKRDIRLLRRLGFGLVTLKQLKTYNTEWLEHDRASRGETLTTVIEYSVSTGMNSYSVMNVEQLSEYSNIIAVSEDVRYMIGRWIDRRDTDEYVCVYLGKKSHSALAKRLNKIGYDGNLYSLGEFRAHAKTLITDTDKQLCSYDGQTHIGGVGVFIESLKKLSLQGLVFSDPQLQAIAEGTRTLSYDDRKYAEALRWIHIGDAWELNGTFYDIMNKYPLLGLDSFILHSVHLDKDKLHTHVTAYVDNIYVKDEKN